ncbi:MAG: hypothetical protein NTY11_01425 [Candidatus Parcubacteria bacterium]|nr:hypothetical protein [Candidatus Parcubacteria bacterium]
MKNLVNETMTQSKIIALVGSRVISSSFVLSGAAFFAPLLFSSPQWLIGSIVNAILFISAEKLDFKRQLPVIVLPSIGAWAHGVIFGPSTIFLLYFLPFIWLGNVVLVRVMGLNRIKQWPFLGRIVIASILKSSVLFLVAYIYIGSQLVPKIFLTSMGAIQFITALAGGVIAYFVIGRKT